MLKEFNNIIQTLNISFMILKYYNLYHLILILMLTLYNSAILHCSIPLCFYSFAFNLFAYTPMI
jgi:hypothetical protein